ncbi:helix-turn-helix transcriptional regulator [Lentibacillus cibarius]|uniref:ArsR family transcriptional regulator n=1 Tax=Lentibacillus cibarius TaxID=2583219 RepID=A0A5S3QJ71_9BACI|nr:ArsR family transcriptional regulator [Lentibacillus cibarius]TMN21261.1 ArsR family transcriptional regulator [Lentibacillus cibarius]
MQNNGSAKRTVLTVLKKENELTISGIMSYFTISEVAVRRHLRELERQGLVKKRFVKQKLGRPYLIYSLTPSGHKTFPSQYESLSLEILWDLEALEGVETVEKVIQKRTEREQAEVKNELNTDDFGQKIRDVAAIQNNKGYMVEVEKIGEDSYEMRHYHCPIAKVASAYRQICSGDQRLYEDLFSEGCVEPRSCIVDGDNCCKWTIKK